MTREYYLQQIRGVEQDLAKMGNDCMDLLSLSMRSLQARDQKLAEEVLNGSKKMEKEAIDIENKCIELLALQQPMASDLRFIITTLRILTDLERISRYAWDIGKITLRIDQEQLLPQITEIMDMFLLVDGMVRDSLKAFITRDLETSRKMGERDDAVDASYDHIRRALIDEMVKNPSSIDMASHLSFVAMYLERTADHSCVIASWTVYMVTGERVRIK